MPYIFPISVRNCKVIETDEKMELVSLNDYEEKAAEKLPKTTLEYYRSGAGDELTVLLNRTCFDRYERLLKIQCKVNKISK